MERRLFLVRSGHAVEARSLTLGGAVRFLNGLPGIILALVAAATFASGYIHKREQLAVERAAWAHHRDKLRVQIITDRIAADRRDKQRDDSIAKLNVRLMATQATARVAGQQFATAAATLHAIVDSNAAAKAALDSLEASHSRQVISLQEAVAIAKAETQVERDNVADRDAQLLKLRGDYAEAITRADGFEKQAHPGAIKRVLDSPVTHIVAFGFGYMMGAN